MGLYTEDACRDILLFSEMHRARLFKSLILPQLTSFVFASYINIYFIHVFFMAVHRNDNNPILS